MKNILILSSSDPSRDAGSGAVEIRNVLQSKGFRAVILTKYKPRIHDDQSVKYYYSATETNIRGIFRRIRHRVIRVITKNSHLDYYMRDAMSFFPLKSPSRIRQKAGFIPDVIIIFFMPEFVNYLDIYRLHKSFKCKIYISAVDMYPFTGLCHYSKGCKKYQENCGACPLINSNYPYDITWFMMKIKQFVSKRIGLYGFAWTIEFEDTLKHSSIFRNQSVLRVPTFLSKLPNMHAPSEMEKNKLRIPMGIKSEDFVLLICAANLRTTTKGVSDITDALRIALRDNELQKNLVVITAGNGDLARHPTAKRVIELGHLSVEDLYKAYWLSDLYVSASKEDVGPGTLAYAFACGVPVVSYNTGLAPELIKDGENGFLVDKGNIEDLAQRIRDFYFLDPTTKSIWSKSVVQRGQDFFDDSWADILVKSITGKQ